MTRTYGRAQPGERVVETTSGYSGAHYTIVATLGSDGVRAPFMFEGAMNSDTFDLYIDKVLLPDLKRRDVLVLDNLSAHKLPDLEARLAKHGVEVIFLPPYSPDLNPIEKAWKPPSEGWSKMKTALRGAKARTYKSGPPRGHALLKAIKPALLSISSQDASNWFAHCGYQL